MAEAESAPYKRFWALLLELRKKLITLAVALVLLTAGFYMLSPHVLALVQRHLGQQLAFFGVMEPFLALLKVALVCAILVLSPFILWLVWLGLAKTFGFRRLTGFFFILIGLLLFYGGVCFCYFVTLPYGVKFLLSFQKENIVPTISVGHFVTFVGIFLLAFGAIFELPLIMVMLTKMGLLDPYRLPRFRRHAVLIIAILAAVLTPTPDVFNMALMGVPLYLLFEIGLLFSRLVSRRAG
jgi:sec-independent protein translocase protein TatC